MTIGDMFNSVAHAIYVAIIWFFNIELLDIYEGILAILSLCLLIAFVWLIFYSLGKMMLYFLVVIGLMPRK